MRITCFKIKINCHGLDNIIISKLVNGNFTLKLNKRELNELFISYNLLHYTFVSWRNTRLLYGAPQGVLLNLKRSYSY